MTTYTLKPSIPVLPKPYPNITEKKKADLDKLALDVLKAQSVVDQYNAVVTALTEKSGKFQAFLASAESKKIAALANLNFVRALVSMANNLQVVSKADDTKMNEAKGLADSLAIMMRDIINKLIYTVDVINRLNNAAVRQKALNPLISDDLITRLANAGTDANNAIALCLISLKSAYTAQATTSEALATTTLELNTSNEFLHKLAAVNLEEYIVNEFRRALAYKDKDNKIINFSNNDVIFTMLVKAIKTAISQKTSYIDIKSKIIIDYEKLLSSKSNDELKQITPMLVATLRSVNLPSNTVIARAGEPLSLMFLIQQRYDTTVNNYNSAFLANMETTKQLTTAQQKLSRAQIKLSSLQAGLGAANAAAFAS